MEWLDFSSLTFILGTITFIYRPISSLDTWVQVTPSQGLLESMFPHSVPLTNSIQCYKSMSDPRENSVIEHLFNLG